MKPIFSRNEEIDKIAFLNWRISKKEDIPNLFNIADGFLSAAIKLAKLSLINNRDKSADILIFAILTNANHGIELYLKAMTWTLNKIIGSEMRIEGGHNIQQIYDTVRARIKDYKGQVSLKEFDGSTLSLKEYIKELFDKIQVDKGVNMDFSRYPLNSKYESHFYVQAVGNVEIDLENFVVRFEEIHLALDNMSNFIYDQELIEGFGL